MDPLDTAGGLPGTSRHWTFAESDNLPVTTPHVPPAAFQDQPSDLSDPFAPSLAVAKGLPAANLAALAISPPGMGTALDSVANPQSLNTRRPGAPTLPSFELPPPPFPAVQKYNGHLNPIQPPPPLNVSVGNLLTPPATNQSAEGASTLQAATVATSVPQSSEAPAYSSYWPQSQSPYAAGSGVPPPLWSAGGSTPFGSRAAFSPSIGRNPIVSPATTEAASQSYDVNQLPPFHQPLSGQSPSAPAAPVQHPQSMTQMILNSQAAPSHPPVTSPSAVGSADPYGPKPQSTPMYGSHQVTSPQQTVYPPPYTGSSTHQVGLGMQPPARMATGPYQPGPPSHIGFPRQPWPSYSLPAMNGPVMTNLHSPNSQMSLLGNMQPGLLPGFTSGHVAGLHHMYGGHGPHQAHGQPLVTDRPFKCDQCPQSFNRNHDLKRHKRIHLSVKPFPCGHCDKSFSRKDALKRHILVKGCGKDGSSDMSSNTHGANVSRNGNTSPGSATKTEGHGDQGGPPSSAHAN